MPISATMPSRRLSRRFSPAVLAASLAVLTINAIYCPPSLADEPDSADPLITWTKTFGDYGSSSAPGSFDQINSAESLIEGGVLVAGTYDGSGQASRSDKRGKADAAIGHYSDDGALQWSTLVGGSQADSFANARVAKDGNYIAAGFTQSSDEDLGSHPSAGRKDILIAKISSNDHSVMKIVTLGGSDSEEITRITTTHDGGYLGVGYTHSKDGDIARLTGKTTTDRDALVVKFNADLDVEWAHTIGGSGNALIQDEFRSVINDPTGGWVAIGTSSSSDGDLKDLNKGKRDILAVKIGSDGSTQWVKTYGGSSDDYGISIARAHNRDFDKNKDFITATTEDMVDGYVIAATSSSTDGDFAKVTPTDNPTKSAAILRIAQDGSLLKVETLTSSADVEASQVLPVSDGFFLTGTYRSVDKDLTGVQSYGDSDIFLAHYTPDLTRLNIHSLGGNAKEIVSQIYPGMKDNYYLVGSTRSTDGPFTSLVQGKYDGFIMSLNASTLESYPTKRQLIPVEAWKMTEDSVSMMNPLVHPSAYVETSGNLHQVTVYLVRNTIAGYEFSPSNLGAITYERDGVMKKAKVNYDASTDVKSFTMILNDLSSPVHVAIKEMMGEEVRLSFTPSQAEKTDAPPTFPARENSSPIFPTTWKQTVGGSDTDFANEVAVLIDGSIVVGGETYSPDLSETSAISGGSNAFIAHYDGGGRPIMTTLFGGTERDSRAYISALSGRDDAGFYAAGSYKEDHGVAPTGVFADTDTEKSLHGDQDAFIARFAPNHQMVWINSFAGSRHDQVKDLVTLADQSVVALIETLSTDGDVPEGARGNVDLVLTRYSPTGEQMWATALSGYNIESSQRGLALKANGNILVAGYTNSGSGTFEGLDFFGNSSYDFDLFVAEYSPTGEKISMKSFGGEANDYLKAITATSDGGYLLAGSTRSTLHAFQNKGRGYDNAFLIKIGSDNAVQWSDVITSIESSEGRSIVEMPDKTIALFGETRGTGMDFQDLNKGSLDSFVALYSPDGKRTRLRTIGGSNTDYAAAMEMLDENHIVGLMSSKSADIDLENHHVAAEDGLLFAFSIFEDKDADAHPLPSVDPSPSSSKSPSSSPMPESPSPDVNSPSASPTSIQPSPSSAASVNPIPQPTSGERNPDEDRTANLYESASLKRVHPRPSALPVTGGSRLAVCPV